MRLVLQAGEQGGGSGTLSDIARRLEAMGYTRVPTVTEVAQFSVRGGIRDAYGFGMAAPVRIEWWGDEIVSPRSIDLASQRSGEPVDRVTVLPVKTEATARRDDGMTERRSLLDLLPSDALVVLEQEAALEQEVDRAWAEAAHHLDVARRLGEEPPAREALFVEPAAWRGPAAPVPRGAPPPPPNRGWVPLLPPPRAGKDTPAIPAHTKILCPLFLLKKKKNN